MSKKFNYFIGLLYKNRFKVTIFIIVVLGLLLRIQPIIKTSMWDDEVISVNIARNTSIATLFIQSRDYWDMVHPPFYYIILKLLLRISDHDYLLRGFSVLFYPLSLAVILALLRTESNKSKIITAALFSFHPLIVKLQYQARMYSIAIFANLLGIFFIQKYLKTGKKLDLFLSTLTLTLAFHLDYLTIWVIISLIFYLLSLFRKHKTEVILVENQIILVLIANICQTQENCSQMLTKVENMCIKNICKFKPY